MDMKIELLPCEYASSGKSYLLNRLFGTHFPTIGSCLGNYLKPRQVSDKLEANLLQLEPRTSDVICYSEEAALLESSYKDDSCRTTSFANNEFVGWIENKMSEAGRSINLFPEESHQRKWGGLLQRWLAQPLLLEPASDAAANWEAACLSWSRREDLRGIRNLRYQVSDKSDKSEADLLKLSGRAVPMDRLISSPQTMYDIPPGLCKKISAAGINMTMKTSSKGGFDIEIGSYTVHVPKYSSIHNPLVQMVLFAHSLYDSTLTCQISVENKSSAEFNESGPVISKLKSYSSNTVSARKDVYVLADTAPENHSFNDHGITKAEDKTEDWRLNITKAKDDTEDWRDITKAEDNAEDARLEKVTWLMATAAVHHATGIRDLLSGFTTIQDLFVKAGDGVSMPVCGRGSVTTGTVVLQDVWFVPGLTENLVSVTQLTELDYSVGFSRAACIIKSAADDAVIGKAHVSEDGLFELDFLKVGPVI